MNTCAICECLLAENDSIVFDFGSDMKVPLCDSCNKMMQDLTKTHENGNTAEYKNAKNKVLQVAKTAENLDYVQNLLFLYDKKKQINEDEIDRSEPSFNESVNCIVEEKPSCEEKLSLTTADDLYKYVIKNDFFEAASDILEAFESVIPKLDKHEEVKTAFVAAWSFCSDNADVSRYVVITNEKIHFGFKNESIPFDQITEFSRTDVLPEGCENIGAKVLRKILTTEAEKKILVITTVKREYAFKFTDADILDRLWKSTEANLSNIVLEAQLKRHIQQKREFKEKIEEKRRRTHEYVSFYSNDPAVLLTSRKAGMLIREKDIADIKKYPKYIKEKGMKIAENALTIGQVIGSKLTVDVEPWVSITPDMVGSYNEINSSTPKKLDLLIKDYEVEKYWSDLADSENSEEIKVVKGLYAYDKKRNRLLCWANIGNKYETYTERIDCSEIIRCEIVKTYGQCPIAGVEAATTGAILAGTAGAIIGSEFAKKTFEVCTHFQLEIFLDNMQHPSVIIPFIDSKGRVESGIPISSDAYKVVYNAVMDLYALLQNIAKENEIQSKHLSLQDTQSVQNVSSADEIRSFKQLLDEGIITEEEFTAKKKQLLGI